MVISQGALSHNGFTVLEDLPEAVTTVDDPLNNGIFLRVQHKAPAARFTAILGRIADLTRFTACHRYDEWWMKPAAGAAATDIPVETQSLIVQRTDGTCVLIIPLLDGSMRCALEGDAAGNLVLVAESNDPAVTADAVTGVYIAAGDDPYALCAAGARSVAHRLGTRLRAEKPLPAFADKFGWCTWDAFYADVSHDKVREGLASFAAAGIRPRMLILDDGWQSVEKNPSSGETRLTAFAANDKFPGDLAPTVRMAKDQFGVELFLVWHAVIGYWGGVNPDRLPGYKVSDAARAFGPGVLHHFPQANDQWWGSIAGVVPPDSIHRFYHDYHRHLRGQGVDGVKVDNQATLEGLAAGLGGRVHLMGRYHEALEGSAAVHFAGNLINCMSCSNDMLYQARASTVTRTSTDFWPKKPESHGLHLHTNAQVGMWFGHFVHADWDMFQSAHAMGAFHAAGRAVSGSPVYVSDKPGEHDAALLKKLVCSDGTTLLCDGPGRPTRDCLFDDVTRDDTVLKVWNTARRGQAGVVGLFHALYHEDPAERRPITATISPSDIPGLSGERFAIYLHSTGTVHACPRADRLHVRLEEGGWDVATVVPIRDGVAVLGLGDKLNTPAGATDVRNDASVLTFAVRDTGDVMVYASTRPTTVTVNGKAAPFTWQPAVLRIAAPEAGRVVVTW